jgi:rhodanese-related sulfurtransferase
VAIAEIDIAEFAPLVTAGAKVIDVREPHEYADGHVPGAELIPLASVPAQLERFAGDGPTYVICRSGARSMRACELAADAGHEVINVTGGIMAWIATGFDVTTGP